MFSVHSGLNWIVVVPRKTCRIYHCFKVKWAFKERDRSSSSRAHLVIDTRAVNHCSGNCCLECGLKQMVERDIKLHVVNHPDDKGSFFSSSAEKLNYLILIGKIALETRVVVEASSIAFKQVFQQINIFLASEVSNPYFVFSRWESWPHFQKRV